MKPSVFLKDVESLCETDKMLSVADFVGAWHDVPMPTVYSRIRALVQAGIISPVGRGLYRAVHKPKFELPVSDWMIRVNKYLVDGCERVNCCLCESNGNLYVEVYKGDIPVVMNCLRQYTQKVISIKDAKSFPSILEGYVIVGPLVSDSPIVKEADMYIPTLEKVLIDSLLRRPMNEKERQFSFQKAMEVYPVNTNRMMRYASRRGVKEELSSCMEALDNRRIEMFSATQKYLASIPVLRAWVFGSFARGEEKPDSDLDLLVDYDKSSQISLLDIVRYKIGLEKILGREVDLIENGCLKPFAKPSAERDKYLIYER